MDVVREINVAEFILPQSFCACNVFIYCRSLSRYGNITVVALSLFFLCLAFLTYSAEGLKPGFYLKLSAYNLGLRCLSVYWRRPRTHATTDSVRPVNVRFVKCVTNDFQLPRKASDQGPWDVSPWEYMS